MVLPDSCRGVQHDQGQVHEILTGQPRVYSPSRVVLIQSGQCEHDSRVVLVDAFLECDKSQFTQRVPQVAVRDGIPRLLCDGSPVAPYRCSGSVMGSCACEWRCVFVCGGPLHVAIFGVMWRSVGWYMVWCGVVWWWGVVWGRVVWRVR